MSLVSKVIINADDFGKDENATMAIAEAFRRGFINQTTLMVNMPWAEKAVELARKERFADKVGLHLNLTEGLPLTEQMSKCRVFCDGDGAFLGHYATREELGHEDVRNALEEEIEAQVLKYVGYALPLMHCDGHHHVQNRLQTARVLIPILAKHGFKTIRRPANAYESAFALHIRSRLLQIRFALMARHNGLQLASSIFGGWSAATERFVRNGKISSVEIMVHPRYDAAGDLVDVTDFRNNTGRKLAEIK